MVSVILPHDPRAGRVWAASVVLRAGVEQPTRASRTVREKGAQVWGRTPLRASDILSEHVWQALMSFTGLQVLSALPLKTEAIPQTACLVTMAERLDDAARVADSRGQRALCRAVRCCRSLSGPGRMELSGGGSLLLR